MKTKIQLYYYMFSLFFAALLLFSSCEKADEKKLPVLTSAEVNEVTLTTATTGGNITDDGGATVTARGVCWSKNQNPTINDSKTNDGNGDGSFSSSITGLEPNTEYYVRAYATNSAGTGYGSAISFTTLRGAIDADGNVYSTVIIGNQEWFVENLRTTKYRNGSSIPNETVNDTWINLSTPAYCWFNNDIDNKPIYGALYNWYTVETGSLCPTGWRVPTEEDWTILINYVGGLSIATTKLKATSGWIYNENGTDEYSFSALPSGLRWISNGNFVYGGVAGFWWSSSEAPAETYAWQINLDYQGATIDRAGFKKGFGLSVRCLKE